MLVLSRRIDEKIIFPDAGITLNLLGIKGNVARLGIDAPPDVRILREELRSAALDQLPKPTPPRTCRTLIVEDDANQRALLAGLLRMNGVCCDTAADGVDALAYLATRERPDVVLLDMVMPRCDGPQTLALIRSEPRLAGLKVFGVSASSPDELGLKSGPGGVDGWFRKPLDPRLLWETIRPEVCRPR